MWSRAPKKRLVRQSGSHQSHQTLAPAFMEALDPGDSRHSLLSFFNKAR